MGKEHNTDELEELETEETEDEETEEIEDEGVLNVEWLKELRTLRKKVEKLEKIPSKVTEKATEAIQKPVQQLGLTLDQILSMTPQQKKALMNLLKEEEVDPKEAKTEPQSNRKQEEKQVAKRKPFLSKRKK